MDLSRKSRTSTNTSEFDQQYRKEMTRSLHAWIIVEKVQDRESLIFFLTYVTFSVDFLTTYNDYLLANVIDSFLLLFW